MMNVIIRLLAGFVLLLLLSACQAEPEETKILVAPSPVEKKRASPETDKIKKIEVNQQQPQRIETQQPQSNVNLKVSAEFLQQIVDKEHVIPTEKPPQTTEGSTDKHKVKISGGVMLDTEKEKVADKIDGGKVNISIPLK